LKYSCVLACAIMLIDARSRADVPEVIVMNGKWLAKAKAEAAAKDSPLGPALSHLVKQAEGSLKAGPFSVMDKTKVPPSGNKHDYMSFGPYWWPDPKKKDGLPYIRRDGETNPESREGSDLPNMWRMVRAIDTLALAYYFTGEKKYAAHAALLLRTWFLKPETRMNPNLEYGEAIPGRCKGRGIGIIGTHMLVKVVDAAALLEGSDAWTGDDHKALKKWFRDYEKWLLTSGNGRDESRSQNNHGTWYDVQVACFALFAGDGEAAKKILQSAGEKRIARQVDSAGRQKHEMARTRSFSYSILNLNGLFCLARLGEHVGIDLWSFRVQGKTAIRAALDYLAPYADPGKKWPRRQITERKPSSLLPLLRQGYLVYEKPEYLRKIEKLPEKTRLNDRSGLLYPVPASSP
jgi:hypothetical protein